MDDDAGTSSDHESEGSDGETDGAQSSRSGEDSNGLRPESDARSWVHPSEFRRFVDLDAPQPPSMLSTADQARRSAIAMAAMGFLLAGLLLLTGGSTPSKISTVELTFTPHPSLMVHFANSGPSAGGKGATVTGLFSNERDDTAFKVGDVIVGCDHAPIANAKALTTCLHRHCIDEQVEIEIVRDSTIRHLKVKLHSGP